MSIDKVLDERGNRYGSFNGNARTVQDCLDVLMAGDNAIELKYYHKEAMHMIVHKLARIVNGDADYADSWVDIAGYAQLVVRHIDEHN
jgi:Domain of unknown function (DUF6378)